MNTDFADKKESMWINFMVFIGNYATQSFEKKLSDHTIFDKGGKREVGSGN